MTVIYKAEMTAAQCVYTTTPWMQSLLLVSSEEWRAHKKKEQKNK